MSLNHLSQNWGQVQTRMNNPRQLQRPPHRRQELHNSRFSKDVVMTVRLTYKGAEPRVFRVRHLECVRNAARRDADAHRSCPLLEVELTVYKVGLPLRVNVDLIDGLQEGRSTLHRDSRKPLLQAFNLLSLGASKKLKPTAS